MSSLHDTMKTSESSSSASDIEHTPPASDTERTPSPSDTEHTPPASDKKYSVNFHMALPPQDHDTTRRHVSKCAASIALEGVDLAFMQKGLFLSTENLLLLTGDIRSYQSVFKEGTEWKWREDKVRTWDLREFPGRPAAESRWTGQLILYANSLRTLNGIRLEQLSRQLIYKAWVTDDAGNRVFNFDTQDPAANKNELFDSDPSDLWWLWPMESIAPRVEGESSSHTQAYDGKKTREPERRVTADRVSWPDVAVLVCAAPAVGAIVVAWGIFALLAAVRIAVLDAMLEFGGYKEKGESVRHATVDRTSWQDVLTGSFRRVTWPSWRGLVTGMVASVWGIGSFALFADEVLHNRLGLVEAFREAAWSSWEELVWGAVVGTWGIGCFVLLANEVLHNRSGYIEFLHDRRWPSWKGLVIGAVVSVWGIGGFTLLANEILQNGFAETFRWVGLLRWWDIVWGTVIAVWGVGSFVLTANMIARNGWTVTP